MSRRSTALIGALLTLGLLAGCAADDIDGTGDAAQIAAAQTYGYGPVRDSSTKYQSDVVLVGGGPQAIRSASADGLVWTIDADAPGADKVDVGTVMYLTSRAVGRVVDVQRAAGDLSVTLAPVGITEVFRDAHFEFDREIDPALEVYQQVPNLPGSLTTPPDAPRRYASMANTADIVLSPIRLTTRASDQLPPARKSSFKVAVGDWEAEPYRSTGKLGLKVGYKAGESLKVSVDFALSVQKLRVLSNVRISGGRLDGRSTFALEGIRGIAIKVAAGAANGVNDNTKIRVEVPVEINIPIAGEPLVYSNTWKFIVSTALTGKNTTVTAAGEWGLDGIIGIVDGELVKPALSVVKSVMDSISGLPIGVSGIAFAVECKIQFGIGIPAAFAGPYTKLVVDLAVTNGSALGAPLPRCVSATLDAKVGGGFGISLSSQAWKALQKLLPTTVKVGLDGEKMAAFFHRSQTLPNVPLCTA